MLGNNESSNEATRIGQAFGKAPEMHMTALRPVKVNERLVVTCEMSS